MPDPPVRLRHARPYWGRPFNTSTKLGKLMYAKQLKVGDVAAVAGISERYLSDFLAGRRRPTEETLVYLARAVGCRPEQIREDDEGVGSSPGPQQDTPTTRAGTGQHSG